MSEYCEDAVGFVRNFDPEEQLMLEPAAVASIIASAAALAAIYVLRETMKEHAPAPVPIPVEDVADGEN
jgi:hypothetical protein